jgi:hypothetical protein
MGRVELRDKENWFALTLLRPPGHRSYGPVAQSPHRTAGGIYDKLHL